MIFLSVNSRNRILPVESRGYRNEQAGQVTSLIWKWGWVSLHIHWRRETVPLAWVTHTRGVLGVLWVLGWGCLRRGHLLPAAQVSQASSQAKTEKEPVGTRWAAGCRHREPRQAVRATVSSHWQMKWLLVGQLTSRLLFLRAEGRWWTIHHLANLSSSTDGFLTPLFPPNDPSPSLTEWTCGKHPTLPNNYEIFTGESYLQFLLNIKLPPLQKEDNLIYKP